MPLHSAEGSDGATTSRWKDGSRCEAETAPAGHSPRLPTVVLNRMTDHGKRAPTTPGPHSLQPLTYRRRQLPIARHSALARDKSGCAVRAEGTAASIDLPQPQPQLVRRHSLRQAALNDTAEDLQAVKLLGAHRQVSRIAHVGLQDRERA